MFKSVLSEIYVASYMAPNVKMGDYLILSEC